jgi:drug/metabolite transporter (DMT)-like permease
VIWALLAAVVSSVAYGVSTIMQAVATRRTAGLAVIRQPLVIAAFAVDALAWVLSLVALDELPLFVVQAIIASSLVVVVVLARFVLGTRMRPIDRAAVVVVVGALVVVSLSGGEQPAVPAPDGFVAVMVAASVVLVVLTAACYRSGSPIVLAVIGGLGYSGAAIAARAATEADGVWGTIVQPLAIAILLCAIAGALAYLRALERGSVGTAAAVVSVLEVVVPGAVGIWVLGDRVRDGWAPAAVVGLVLAVVGCVALALSPANAAAEASAAESAEARKVSPPAVRSD